MRVRAALMVAAILASGVVCGDRRPVVVNRLSQTISVITTWEDGSVSHGELSPAGVLFLSDPPRYPSKITISIPGGDAQTFTRDNASELLGGAPTGPIVGWQVTDSGILPLTEADLESR